MNVVHNDLPTTWRRALALLTILIVWVLYWYRDTATAMVGIWTRSETYAHAFVVLPISLWLVWRERKLILAERPQSSLLLAIPVCLTTFAWLLGELTAVNALTQFALVATLVLAIMALLGISVSKRISFPLAFLFFAVPFGDFMMPQLMTWTASFTVLALRTSGVPVYQEGLQFVIPSGNWSVVEACSGIRYMIASLTVGTLFAYLNYASLKRRLIFIGFSLVVPIVANWLRAYIIVMLGHLSGNKIAAGVDHLIYGWLFFGIVIMVMFMIGARWAEPEIRKTPTDSAYLARNSLSWRAWLAAPIIALIAAAGPAAYSMLTHNLPADQVDLKKVIAPSGWQETDQRYGWLPEYANPSAELNTAFKKDGKSVELYVALYRNQDFARKLITSTNVLVASNDKSWSVTSSTLASTEEANLPSEIRRSEILGRNAAPETRLVVWHWYWVGGQLTTSEAKAKWYAALSRLMGHGDDSAAIFIYTEATGDDSHFSALANEIASTIHQSLAAAQANQ